MIDNTRIEKKNKLIMYHFLDAINSLLFVID